MLAAGSLCQSRALNPHRCRKRTGTAAHGRPRPRGWVGRRLRGGLQAEETVAVAVEAEAAEAEGEGSGAAEAGAASVEGDL